MHLVGKVRPQELQPQARNLTGHRGLVAIPPAAPEVQVPKLRGKHSGLIEVVYSLRHYIYSIYNIL